MATQQIDETRVQRLNDREPRRRGRDYVLYWMQQSQRAVGNHALEHAVQRANELGKRLLVVFGLMDDYPEANARHYRFMLEGLADAAAMLRRRKIKFAVRRGHPAEVAIEMARHAALVVCDRGYLRHQKEWRQRVADAADVRVERVETDVVVPVEVASDKAEYAAHTIRPKLNRHRDACLVDLRPTPLDKDSLNLSVDGLDADDIDGPLAKLKIDRTVAPVPLFTGGHTAASAELTRFLKQRFDRYRAHRNQPHTDDISYMSMFLHFGHISPVELALKVRDADTGSKDDRETYLEELIVRRELAMNFVHYTPDYDDYTCLPDWARRTLEQHERDDRPHRYTPAQLDAADTHDPYWNAAMREMRHTGYMHNYMRMYWGKKVLEWTGKPETAFRWLVDVNDRYELDGRDPNGYAGVAWCFGKHDRPWPERDVFGTVRSMNAKGLARKFDRDAYVRQVTERLAAAG